MAGKSNKSKNKRGGSQISNSTTSSAEPAAASSATVASKETIESNSNKADANGVSASKAAAVEAPETSSEKAESQSKPVEGEALLYPVSVKAPSGEKLELRLSPGDSVMDLRQFLVDAPETCFFTCYDLVLHAKDKSVHYLEDHNEISEVADITTGGCSLEMVDALYDDRSIRAHVQRARELLSFSTLHASLSTSLALQQEKVQKSIADAEKGEVRELDGLGFMEDIGSSLSNLVSCSSKNIKCVESIVFSSFNPPPSYRRLVGDLIYIDIVTLEGRNLCITGTTKTFYVNSSSGNTLDPKPAKIAVEATTLIGLLQKISSKFKKAFHEILELKGSAHPFESVQSPLPPNSWLGAYPVSDHMRDAARAEGAVTLSYGSELVGMQRDWNEELQSCREFPHTTPQERILRGRALYKVTSDFVDAAISGAVGVISRCIPPINPTDPECFHMYVHNNIFFSFAVDADLGQLTRNQVSNVEVKLDSPDSLPDASGKASSKLSSGINGSDAVDVNGVTDVSADVTADTELADSDQATYASANNDLKGTKAYQKADVSGLYNLAMAIVDYRGYRLVAQSIIPGILQGDKSDSLLYGSVDNGKKICWNEAFHSKVLEAAKRLHVKEHTVLDGSGNVVKLAAPVECKGIVGADERHYLLDLNRITPRDVNYNGPGTRNYVLRHELVSAFCKAEAEERLKGKSKVDEEVTKVTDLSDVVNPESTAASSNSEVNGGEVPRVANLSDEVISESTAASSNSQLTDGEVSRVADLSDDVNRESTTEGSNSQEPKEEDNKAVQECVSASAENGVVSDDVLLNPNVFTEFKLAGSSEDIGADEENVRKACLFLKDVVLPRFVQDLCTLEVSPMDGQTLTEALHAHGINVRYIGKVADMTKHLPHIWDLCATEIVVRSTKHIFKEILRESQDHDLGHAVSHFFNCFFGPERTGGTEGTANSTQSQSHKKDRSRQKASGGSSRGHSRWKKEESSKKNQSSYMHITSEGLWSDIQEFAKFKYQFDVPENARSLVKRVSAIRNLCQKVGVTIAARKYDFDVAAPFQVSDILNLQPVVKHSVPLCTEAKDLVETGKAQLAEGMLNEAYTLFSEAFSILQQVTGPMHREVANCCRYLAMVLYHAGDMSGAITHQHKELIINERCLGLDHPDTAHSYGNMALFYHGLNQPELALRHMSRTMLLLGLSCGPDHPDVAATFINVAMMYQDIGKMDIALRYLQEALKKNERLLGEEHIQTAVCYHALAIAFNCMGAFKLSLQHETKTYDILVKQLGEEDSRTRDSQNWINTFKVREIQVNTQKQKGQEVNAASAQKALDLLKAHPDLLQAFQIAAAGGSANVDPSVNKTISAAMMGEILPRGRGIDERAARAAADARKKAAARGLIGRSVQNLPPQLLDIINSSGTNQETQSHAQAQVSTKEANGPKMNGPVDTKENGTVTSQESQAPDGLGAGLASLKAKKSKKKSKAAA